MMLQIRRRRLAKLGEGSTEKPKSSDEIGSVSSVVIPSAISSSMDIEYRSPEIVQKVGSNMSEALNSAFATAVADSSNNFKAVVSSTAEVKVTAGEQLKPKISNDSISSTIQVSPAGTPSRKRDITVSATNKSAPLSGGKSEIHNLIATNLALESVFLVTYRAEAAHGPIRYIGSSNGTDVTDYINHTNVSEIVCTLLSEESVVGGAIGYLIGSYKRLLEKENTVESRVQVDLIR